MSFVARTRNPHGGGGGGGSQYNGLYGEEHIFQDVGVYSGRDFTRRNKEKVSKNFHLGI